MEREGVLEHGEGSTVLWTSTDLWNPSQQYEFGSLGAFSESTALTGFDRNKMCSAENFWSMLPVHPWCLSPITVKCQMMARCSWPLRLAYGIWEHPGQEHNFASSWSLKEFHTKLWVIFGFFKNLWTLKNSTSKSSGANKVFRACLFLSKGHINSF